MKLLHTRVSCVGGQVSMNVVIAHTCVLFRGAGEHECSYCAHVCPV